MKIGYLRVSSVNQNLDRQYMIKDLVDEVFEEKASAGSLDRPVLQQMITFARKGDQIIVYSIDRLARSLKDLFTIIETLKEKQVSITFVKENMTLDPLQEEDPFTTLQFSMIGIFAQFERSLSKQRQREGIEKAKSAGKYKGRKRQITDEQIADIIQRIEEHGTPQATIARELNVSPTTVSYYVKTYREKMKIDKTENNTHQQNDNDNQE